MGNFTINTKETVATAEFINTFLKVGHPSLLIGNAGCGKT
jgi:MoxR-like ATPase